MRTMQEIEHTNSMQSWKKMLVLFLVIACIAAVAYHRYHPDTGMIPDSTEETGTVEVAQAQTTPQPVPQQLQTTPQTQPIPQQPQTTPQAQPAPQQPQTTPQTQPIPQQPQTTPQAQPAPQQPQTTPQAQPAPQQPQTTPQAQPAPQQPQTTPQAQPALQQPQTTPQVQPAPQQPQTTPQAQTAPQTTQTATKFSGVALLGNSRIDGFHVYNSLPGADCLYRVGLNVRTVYTKPMVGEKTPILDKLLEKQYTHIFLTFGDNELGWQYPEIFIEEYQKLIETIQKQQPDAKIYIQSILPVSAEASRKNENNTNNERIRTYNTLLRALAEKMQLPYLDVATGLQDDKGNLPDDAATDGIHLGETYNKKWADLIAQQITKGVTE